MTYKEPVQNALVTFEDAYHNNKTLPIPFKEEWYEQDLEKRNHYRNACREQLIPGTMYWSYDREHRHPLILIGSHLGTIVVFRSEKAIKAVFPNEFPVILERILLAKSEFWLNDVAAINFLGTSREPGNVGQALDDMIRLISNADGVLLQTWQTKK